jgi:hypothetical protein
MKQKDIAVLLIIIFIAGAISFVVAGDLFSNSADTHQKAPVVDVINPDFPLPSAKYFNSNSIDPTQLIVIGNSNNTNPFAGSP